jgi:nucleoside-diphosphate-sugar epimerase
MRTVVIGGKGHIGTYLVPRLVEAGHEVICVTRGEREPYQPHAAWASVRNVILDRRRSESHGTFGQEIRELRADVVVDLICFTVDSARQITEALRDSVEHFLHCGTLWVHGHSVRVPTTEDEPRRPFGEYGIQKAAIEAYLLGDAKADGFPATILHPGHIVGRGWNPLNPAGHFDPRVFGVLKRGEKLALPNLGLETVHHVHADDVAQGFKCAIDRRAHAVGEAFHIVSPQAMRLRGYAEGVAGWYGREAHLEFLPWEDWQSTVSEKDAAATWDHIGHSPNASIAKARERLGYEPRYSSLDAVREAVFLRDG